MPHYREAGLEGLIEISHNLINDERGQFIKVFEKKFFEKNDLDTNCAEVYVTRSKKNVIRGLHFQLPPMDHVKQVCCLEGDVLDVVVDLRLGSPTYSQFSSIYLSASKANSLYIPRGMAHGFYVISEQALMMYRVSTAYSNKLDAGILWSSIGMEWPMQNSPIISKRDQEFPTLSEFVSPFVYE